MQNLDTTKNELESVQHNTGRDKISKTTEYIRCIHKHMKPRLDAHNKYLKIGSNRKTPYPQDALAPCEVVNYLLGALVEKCNEDFTLAETKEIQARVNDISEDLRDISNLAEGEMERTSLNYIFKVYQDERKIPQVSGTQTNREKYQVLQDIICTVPEQSKTQREIVDEEFPFPYLDNYDVMAENELRLLTKDSSVPDLTGKTITFVGAGFPLSAIMYHIHSGAKIKLVDIDKNACERAQDFLALCEKSGILKQSDFEIIHGNAKEIQYSYTKEHKDFAVQFPQGNTTDEQHKTVKPNKTEIKTDVLVLAAALPAQIKADALKNIASSIHIINRCTSTLNNLLYPRTKLSHLLATDGQPLSEMYTSSKLMYPAHCIEEKKQKNNLSSEEVVKTSEINQNSGQFLAKIRRSVAVPSGTISR